MEKEILAELRQMNTSMSLLIKLLSSQNTSKSNISEPINQNRDVASEVRMKIEDARKSADQQFSQKLGRSAITTAL